MEWTQSGVEGMQRFVRRLWRIVNDAAERAPASAEPGNGELARKAHRTIARATDDLGRRLQFNTPISAVMELVNELAKAPDDPAAGFAAETAVSLIQPWAPHVAEELWEKLGHEHLWEHPWPVADPALLEEDTFELVVQVNGKVRDRFEVPVDLPEEELVARAKESPKVQAQLNGGEIRQTIVVPRKLVNLVT
jgi:leucyl-tRNA synthetase